MQEKQSQLLFKEIVHEHGIRLLDQRPLAGVPLHFIILGVVVGGRIVPTPRNQCL